MSDKTDDHKVAKRGDAAWREAKERISERNIAAKKEGKQRRQAYEKAREDSRRTADLRRRASMLGTKKAK